MTYAEVKNPSERADLVAYLAKAANDARQCLAGK
jgi:cytochrome c2